ncbi:hypothetical protein GQ600_5729 [Phytophthora cactorum]|nr:hypothetical protein GQ600_5729 [Phytophthora cactorum]
MSTTFGLFKDLLGTLQATKTT